MDTLVGFVSFVYDSETIKLRITQQDHNNKLIYDTEEKVRLTNYFSYENASGWRSIADISLVEDLLYKMIEVKVEKRDPFEIIGKVSLLGIEGLKDQIHS